jgi:hypothetical protein
VRWVLRRFDWISATFAECKLVDIAGLLLVATKVTRRDLERLIHAMVRLPGRVGGAMPWCKVLTLDDALVAGAGHIEYADVLRWGATAPVPCCA